MTTTRIAAASIVAATLIAVSLSTAVAQEDPQEFETLDLTGFVKKFNDDDGVAVLLAHPTGLAADEPLSDSPVNPENVATKELSACEILVRALAANGDVIDTIDFPSVTFTKAALGVGEVRTDVQPGLPYASASPWMATVSLAGLEAGSAYEAEYDRDCDGVIDGGVRMPQPPSGDATEGCSVEGPPWKNWQDRQLGSRPAKLVGDPGTGAASVTADIDLSFQTTRDSGGIIMASGELVPVPEGSTMVAKGTAEGEIHGGVATHGFGPHSGFAMSGFWFAVWEVEVDVGVVGVQFEAIMYEEVGVGDSYRVSGGGTAGIAVEGKPGVMWAGSLFAHAYMRVHHTGGHAAAEGHLTSVAWCGVEE